MKTIRDTSRKVVEHMCSTLPDMNIFLPKDIRILEPSAGEGNLIEHLIEHVNKLSITPIIDRLNFRCIELNSDKRKKLTEKGLVVFGSDFLDFGTSIDTLFLFDMVIACPPFKNGIDTVHIMKMYELVKENGVVLTLTHPRWISDNTEESIKFRNFLENKKYSMKLLPDNSFMEKGKSVPTAILTIIK